MPKVEFAGSQIEVTRPMRTDAVLLWRVWLPSLPVDEYIEEALLWVSKWSGLPIPELWDAVSSSPDVEPDLGEILKLGHRICATAELNAELAAQMATALDIQNEVDPDWKPKDLFCTCPKCRRDDVQENPPGIDCKYDSLSPVALAAASAAMGVGEGAASEPYYLVQIRGISQRAQSRMLRFQREERAEKKTQQDIVRRALGSRTH